MVTIKSGIYDEVGNMIQGAGFVTTASLAGMFVIGQDGNLKSMVEASTEGVYIKAENIKLEGLVTANDNFKILKDGSIEAKNATIKGDFEGSVGNGVVKMNADGFSVMGINPYDGTENNSGVRIYHRYKGAMPVIELNDTTWIDQDGISTNSLTITSLGGVVWRDTNGYLRID